MSRLDGRVYVVTGGGSGIGKATSARIVGEGGRVAIWDVREDAASRAAEEIGATALACDVADEASVINATAKTVELLGSVNGLVNAAGVFRVEGSVETAPIEEWDLVVSINLKSVFLTGKHLIPHLRKGPGAAIVNIASLYGFRGYPDECAYDASKGGVVNLTRHMAIQYAAEGIRVNAVAPGEIETPLMLAQLRPGQDLEELKAAIAQVVPMKRVGQPEEIAAAIAFFLSDDASYVTGATLSVDGGVLAG